MAKPLTDTQRVILACAAARTNLRVLPAPTSLRKNAGAIAQSIKGLIGRGLVAEIPWCEGDAVWSGAEGTDRNTLIATADGLVAIGIEPRNDTDGRPAHPAAPEPRPLSAAQGGSRSPREGTKLAALIDLLSSVHGSTIKELVEATKWQAHSVRGAISGALKKKLGLEVTSETVVDRGRVYRIVPALGDQGKGTSSK